MKKLLLMAVIAVIGVAGWRLRTQSHEALDGEGKLLVDRVWIDHVPKHERDPINFLALISEHKVGVFQSMTAFRGSYEMFHYDRGGGQLIVNYPQTRETEKLSVKVRRCTDDGMDFCLDVTGASRGVQHYYSRKDWVIKSLADERALADKLDAAR